MGRPSHGEGAAERTAEAKGGWDNARRGRHGRGVTRATATTAAAVPPTGPNSPTNRHRSPCGGATVIPVAAHRRHFVLHVDARRYASPTAAALAPNPPVPPTPSRPSPAHTAGGCPAKRVTTTTVPPALPAPPERPTLPPPPLVDHPRSVREGITARLSRRHGWSTGVLAWTLLPPTPWRPSPPDASTVCDNTTPSQTRRKVLLTLSRSNCEYRELKRAASTVLAGIKGWSQRPGCYPRPETVLD